MAPTLDRVLLDIALNLSSHLSSEQQYQDLIEGIDKVFPCDASALFILDEDGFLTPVAIKGLASTVLGRRFFPKSHPRLQAIVSSQHPVRFEADSDLPDPFDGSLLTEHKSIDVHDCLGCSLYVEGQLVGALTLDALTVGAFDEIEQVTIETFAALAAATLRNISQLKALKAKNRQQKSVNDTLIQQARLQQGEMIGLSPQMSRLRTSIDTVAKSDYAVLISGETGTGKELVAHQLHAESNRKDKPMIHVNCAALPESLAESELFGHVKGAFTGANSNRLGKFELADGGTIFLDEVGELPLILQAKFLRVIQQGELQRVGSDKHLLVNVRIIAATNRELRKEVEIGSFRSDLYHRLNVFPIHVPALRERAGDVPVLAGYLLEKVRFQFNVPSLHIDPNALTALETQPWLGNVRELEHSLTRAALRAIQDSSNTIKSDHFDAQLLSNDVKNTTFHLPTESTPMRSLVESYQKDLIQYSLQLSGNNWSKAAQFLQIDRGNFYRMGKKFGIDI